MELVQRIVDDTQMTQIRLMTTDVFINKISA